MFIIHITFLLHFSLSIKLIGSKVIMQFQGISWLRSVEAFTLSFFSTDTKGHYIYQLVCILETSTMWQIKAQEMRFCMLY